MNRAATRSEVGKQITNYVIGPRHVVVALSRRPASGSRFHQGRAVHVSAPPSTHTETEEGNEISWARFDDNYDSNPKIVVAGLHGKSLHESSIRWCCRHQTNGRIPKEALPLVATLAQLPPNKTGRQAAAERLVELNLWEDAGDVWLVHDFAEYGPPQKWRSEAPQYGSRNSELYRKENDGLRQKVKDRANGHCYICGLEVDWLDRRSGRGATYEHIDPDGPNSLENLAVACRSCNVRKGKTTDKILWHNRNKTEANKTEQDPVPVPVPVPVPDLTPIPIPNEWRAETIALCDLLVELMQVNGCKVPEPMPDAWLADMERLLRLDGREAQQVDQVIRWSQQDAFWKTNIHSPAKLRQQYDKLRLKMEAPVAGTNRALTAGRDWLDVADQMKGAGR